MTKRCDYRLPEPVQVGLRTAHALGTPDRRATPALLVDDGDASGAFALVGAGIERNSRLTSENGP